MKIAFVIPCFPLLSETFILNQIVGLISHGHQVYIFSTLKSNETTRHPDVEKYNLMDKVFYFSDIPKNKIKRLFICFNFIIKSLFYNPQAVFFSLSVIPKGRASISQVLLYKLSHCMIDFDIIHCQFGNTGRYGLELKAINKHSRLVTTFHGFDIRRGIKKGGQIYHNLFQGGDCFISISEHNTNHLIDFGLTKNKIVPHPVGIDTAKFIQTEKRISQNHNNSLIISTVARLVEEKALHIAIKAVAKTVLDLPGVNITYNIVGDGPLKSELLNLVYELNLQEFVRFLGPLTQSEVASVLKESDIFLFSSIAEVLPVSLMEAQASGLPVVTTDVGDSKKIVLNEETGFVVEQNDIDSISQKLCLLIRDPEMRMSMGTKGRSHTVSNFDITALNVKLIGIYRNLLTTASDKQL